MEGNLSIESKTIVYETQHILKSAANDDSKWKAVQSLHNRLVEEGSLKYSCVIPLQDVLKDLLTLSVQFDYQQNLLHDFFLNGNHCDTFLVLVHSLNDENIPLFPSESQDSDNVSDVFSKIAVILDKIFENSASEGGLEYNVNPNLNEIQITDLLEKFIMHSNLRDMILEQCIIQEYGKNTCLYFHKWDEIISLLVSLPERVANKFKRNLKKTFQMDMYITHVNTSILFVLYQIHKRLSEEKDTNLEFLSKLLGKLCILGYSNKILDYLCDNIVKVLKSDFLWRRIIQRLILGVPSRSMESVLKSLLQKLKWFNQVEWFLGNSVNSSQNIQYLLTTKFLIISYFEKDVITRNIIGYLAQSSERRKIFYKTVMKLLDIWSDGSALKHQTYLQQLYLTRILMICTGYLQAYGIENYKQDFLNKLMQGVHNHIASSESSIRLLGMIIGESMSSIIDPEGPKLKFEYEMTEEAKYLNSLLTIPNLEEENNQELENMSANSIKREEINFEQSDIRTPSCNVNEDLDSDDDLEPYDLETGNSQNKYPLYIQECLEGLMQNDKPEWFEACLQSAENLIKQHPDNLEEVAIDFCKILLHLEDSFSTANFIKQRHNALVALCTNCPLIIADFLVGEFYNRNYNIRQRLDILQVISAASRELSEIKKDLADEKIDFSLKTHKLQMEDTWKNIIEKRIASKTKIISKGRKEIKSKENKFSLVAGHFFFPLLAQFDRTENTYNLLGEDSFLLGHLIYTLGIVMSCAINIPIAFQMGKCFLEFIWVLKFHSDKFVQKALLFALCTVITTVPSHFLLTDLQDDVFECQQWLQDIVCKDEDLETKKLATQILGLIINIYRG